MCLRIQVYKQHRVWILHFIKRQVCCTLLYTVHISGICDIPILEGLYIQYTYLTFEIPILKGLYIDLAFEFLF
jgi:hypothetical protein